MQSFFLLRRAGLMLALTIGFSGGAAFSQSTSGSVAGSVVDSTGAEIPGAKVVIENPESGYTRTLLSDSGGQFKFLNLPFDPYIVTVTASGFQGFSKAEQMTSTIAVAMKVTM